MSNLPIIEPTGHIACFFYHTQAYLNPVTDLPPVRTVELDRIKIMKCHQLSVKVNGVASKGIEVTPF